MRIPYKKLCRALGVKENLDKESARGIAEKLDSPLSETENMVTRMFFDMFPKTTSMAVTATLINDICKCHFNLNYITIVSNVEEIFGKKFKSSEMSKLREDTYKEAYLEIFFDENDEIDEEEFLLELSQNRFVSRYDYSYNIPKGEKSPFADDILREIGNIDFDSVLSESVAYVKNSKDKTKATENLVYIVSITTDYDEELFRSSLEELLD